jgi:predicted secreted hydrolase
MNIDRRAWLRDVPLGAAAALFWRGAQARATETVDAVEPLIFPRDHGAHLDCECEWWSLKGEVQPGNGPKLGVHITFYRMRIASAMQMQSNFAPRQVLAARGSITDSLRGLLHEQCAARSGFGVADAARGDLALKLRDWTFTRSGAPDASAFAVTVRAHAADIKLRAVQSQPKLLHGPEGRWDLPDDRGNTSAICYCLPKLDLEGELVSRERRESVSGQAWLDHGWGRREWFSGAGGTDWFGLTLHDRSVVMVRRIRRGDGSAVTELATVRQPERADRVMPRNEIKTQVLETWRSPTTGAAYPVVWRLELAGTAYIVRARIKSQEIDGGSGIGIGDIFWAGLCDVRDSAGRDIGSGVLEMSGYARGGAAVVS